MKTIHCLLTDDEWVELQACLDHHGQLSHVLRAAVKTFICDKRKLKVEGGEKKDGRVESSKGRRSK